MTKRRKAIGRPKGSTAKQQLAQELIASGMTPLDAFTQAGFSYPARELKRQAGAIAEAQGKDPLAVLEAIAKFGTPADAISACAAILQSVDDDPESAPTGGGVQIFIVGVRGQRAAV